jgi:hypothetical protein
MERPFPTTAFARSAFIRSSRFDAGSYSLPVLVQREMENWRSPLASIPPCSADQLGEHRATQVATGELGGG